MSYWDGNGKCSVREATSVHFPPTPEEATLTRPTPLPRPPPCQNKLDIGELCGHDAACASGNCAGALELDLLGMGHCREIGWKPSGVVRMRETRPCYRAPLSPPC